MQFCGICIWPELTSLFTLENWIEIVNCVFDFWDENWSTKLFEPKEIDMKNELWREWTSVSRRKDLHEVSAPHQADFLWCFSEKTYQSLFVFGVCAVFFAQFEAEVLTDKSSAKFWGRHCHEFLARSPEKPQMKRFSKLLAKFDDHFGEFQVQEHGDVIGACQSIGQRRLDLT